MDAREASAQSTIPRRHFARANRHGCHRSRYARQANYVTLFQFGVEYRPHETTPPLHLQRSDRAVGATVPGGGGAMGAELFQTCKMRSAPYADPNGGFVRVA